LSLINSGNVPARLYYFTYENVPSFGSFAAENITNNDSNTRLVNSDGEVITKLMPQQTINGFSDRIFVMSTTGFDCSGTTTATITVGYQAESTYDVPITYNSVEDDLTTDCEITINEQP
jgi:hypothetical protein